LNTKNRTLLRKEFAIRHADLIARCKKIDSRMVHVSEDGMKLIALAKSELGYRKTAGAGSIIEPLLR